MLTSCPRLVQVLLGSLLLGTLVCNGPVVAQEVPSSTTGDARGLPHVQNFGPTDYTAQRGAVSIGHNQNWDVAQGPGGVIYVANTEGVLAYDGARWTALPIEGSALKGRGKMGSTLTRSPDGSLLVGSTDTFGALVPDSVGRLHYRAYSDSLPGDAPEFGRVWKACSTSRGAYFLTDHHLFRRSDGRLDAWTVSDALGGQDPSATDDLYFFLCYSVRDRLYVQIRGAGLFRMQDEALRLVPGGATFAEGRVYTMLPYPGDRILVGTRNDGFFLFDGLRITPFETDADAWLREAQLYDGTRLPDGNYALATRKEGILVVDTSGAVRTRIDEAHGLRNNMVRAVFVDRAGSLWAALNDGLARIDLASPLRRFGASHGLSGRVNVLRRYQGQLYTGTTTGLYRFRPPSGPNDAHGSFHPVPGIDVTCSDLLPTRHGLLAATNAGVHIVRGERAQLVVSTAPGDPRVLHRSRHHPSRVYVGGTNGLGLVRLQNGRWDGGARVDSVQGQVLSVAEDSTGAIWSGTYTHGIVRWTPETSALARYDTTDGLPVLIDSKVLSFDGTIRVATRRGLYRYAPVRDHFVPDSSFGARYADGSRFVTHVVPGAKDAVWLRSVNVIGGTDKQISRLTPTPDGAGYTVDATIDDLRHDVVTMLEPDGNARVWLGVKGKRGPLVRYDPSLDADSEIPAPLVRKMNAGGAVRAGGAAPELPIIEIAPNTTQLRISYAMPWFRQADRVQYQVRLDGLDTEWSGWTDEGIQQYTTLSPGSYRFRVRARTPTGRISDPTTLAFTVQPPWYRTTWAYLLWGLLGLGLVAGTGLGIAQWRNRRLEARRRALQQQVDAQTEELQEEKRRTEEALVTIEEQAEQLKELDEAKSRFFANVSHEFRTPLTLLLGPIEDALEGDEPVSGEPLRMMHRNAERLQHLINQLLDLSALDAGGLTLEPVELDLVAFVRQTAHAFAPLAERRSLEFVVDASPDALPWPVDRDKLEKVLANLLSNAIKFTPEGGCVHVALATHSIDGAPTEALLSVRDTGPGIPAEEQDRLFDRFHQSQRPSARTREHEGSGIGLALASELVELHGGTIEVESTEGEGTTFTVRLPAEPPTPQLPRTTDDADPAIDVSVPVAPKDAAPGPTEGARDSTTDTTEPPETDRPVVLVVDDHADVRRYVRSVLADRFVVRTAADGENGLAQARDLLPDCVVADVMMPEMDGFAMGRALQDDPLTAGIPLLFLTARAAEADEVEGFTLGADAYLTKPFSAKVLTARVQGLIDKRRQLRKRLQEEGLDVDPPNKTSPFVEEVRSAIQDHLANPEFGVSDLASAVALSRSQLYRRLQSELDASPSELIQRERLRQAHVLLRQREGTVTEIGYAVGFDSLSHFCHIFRERYDTSPSEVLPDAPA